MQNNVRILNVNVRPRLLRHLWYGQRLYVRWARQSWVRRGLLLEALFCLALARLLVLAVPFGKLVPLLGRPVTTPPVLVAMRPDLALQLGWAVGTMSRYTPWQSTCLVQSLAAQWMLRRRGLVSVLYLGLARHVTRELEAHAWLCHGPVVVTGAQGRERFTIIFMLTSASVI